MIPTNNNNNNMFRSSNFANFSNAWWLSPSFELSYEYRFRSSSSTAATRRMRLGRVRELKWQANVTVPSSSATARPEVAFRATVKGSRTPLALGARFFQVQGSLLASVRQYVTGPSSSSPQMEAIARMF